MTTASAPGLPSASLRQRLMGGAFWVAVTQTAAQLIQFVITAVLAHLVTPAEFGTVALCFVVVGVATAFREIGLPQAIIQQARLTPAALNFSFAALMAVSFVLAAGVAAGATPLARLLGAPRAVPVLIFFGAAFPLLSLGLIPAALLRRAMDFRRLGWAEVGQAVANGAVALPLAWRGWGVWSLAAGFVAGTAAYTVLVFAFARWRPGIRFTRADARGLLPFGLGVTGANLAYAFRSYVDKYLVGRFLGAAALGGYQLAFRIVTAPEQRVAWLVSRVIFPGLAAIQGDDERIGRIWRKALTVIGLIAAPALAAVAVCADDFVLVVFGPPWRFIVPALRIMSVAGVFFALGSTAGTVFLAKGRADVEFRISIVNAVLLALALVFGVRFGVAGVAWAVVGQAAVGYALALATAMALIKMTVSSLARALAAPAVVTAAVTAAAFCFRGAVAAAPPLRLAGALGAAGVAYAGALWLLRIKELAEVFDFAKGKWRGMRTLGRDVPTPAEEVG